MGGPETPGNAGLPCGTGDLETGEPETGKPETVKLDKHYTYNTLDADERSAVVDVIEDLIDSAGKYGGRVYGGYVRDSLHNMFKHDLDKLNDVDIWFQDSEQLQKFASLNLFTLVPRDGERNSAYTGEVTRCYYTLPLPKKGGSFRIYFDLVYWKPVPVNDFNVNCLTYSAFSEKEARKIMVGDRVRYIKSWSYHDTIDDLVTDIRYRRMRLLPGYGMDNKELMRIRNMSYRYQVYADHELQPCPEMSNVVSLKREIQLYMLKSSAVLIMKEKGRHVLYRVDSKLDGCSVTTRFVTQEYAADFPGVNATIDEYVSTIRDVLDRLKDVSELKDQLQAFCNLRLKN